MNNSFCNWCFLSLCLVCLLFALGLKTDFETRCHGGPGEKSGPLMGRNLPEVVNKIVWVRQLIHKVTEGFLQWFSTCEVRFFCGAPERL